MPVDHLEDRKKYAASAREVDYSLRQTSLRTDRLSIATAVLQGLLTNGASCNRDTAELSVQMADFLMDALESTP
jgi:hypothetical protein